MATRLVRRLLGVTAMTPLLLIGCDGSIFDPFNDGVGTYGLSIYAGRTVPVTIICSPGECDEVPNGGEIDVNSGTLELHGDGTFEETNHFTLHPSGGSSQNTTYFSEGTYSLNGDELRLSDPSRSRFVVGTLESAGNDVRINYVENGLSFEYRR